MCALFCRQTMRHINVSKTNIYIPLLHLFFPRTTCIMHECHKMYILRCLRGVAKIGKLSKGSFACMFARLSAGGL